MFPYSRSIIDSDLDERQSEKSCFPDYSKIESFFSSEPTIYKEEMPVETLKNALDYYFRIFFCPDYDIHIYMLK